MSTQFDEPGDASQSVEDYLRATAAELGLSPDAAVAHLDQTLARNRDAVEHRDEHAQDAEVCEHYWSWVSPAGTSRFARLCMLCHQPDPSWLNHIVDVDTSDACTANPCVHCEFAEVLDPRLSPAEVGYSHHHDHDWETSDGVQCCWCGAWLDGDVVRDDPSTPPGSRTPEVTP